MTKKLWNILPFDKSAAAELSSQLNISSLAASVLCSRGITSTAKAESFLSTDICSLFDPFLLNDMLPAVSQIRLAIANHEKIAVYGDYDVDGMTATSILILYLRSIGADCEYYIPDRLTEGYGLNCSALLSLKNRGVSLIITVDSGVTAIDEVNYASQIGLKVIITDHHECLDTLPNALAVINPMRRDSTYPFKSLAGVGVAFKLICALDGPENTQALLNNYAELICIGTIADIMPITSENRIIVSAGLYSIANAKNHGLKMLIQCALPSAKSITSSSVGYTIAPRINAAGRMGCAEKAVELFLCDNDRDAAYLAEFLCEQNRRRQLTEAEIFENICERLKTDFNPQRDKIIIMWGENWHNGVIGIVASKIAERYSVPVLLISIDNGEGKGSGRSISGFNLFDAIQSCSHLLEKFGGHELAVGITIKPENLENFRREMLDYANKKISCEVVSTIDIDCEVSPEELTVPEIAGLSVLEPFGLGNKVPLFFMPGVTVREIIPFKSDRHLRLTVEKNGFSFSAFIFGTSLNLCPIIEGEIADIVFSAEINSFRGKESVRFIINDIKSAANSFLTIEQDLSLYIKFKSGDPLSPSEAESLIPTRREFINVFRYIKSNCENDLLCCDCRALYRRIRRENPTPFSLARMKICLDVFNEFNIFTVDDSDDFLTVRLNPTEGKADINGSAILAAIKNRVCC